MPRRVGTNRLLMMRSAGRGAQDGERQEMNESTKERTLIEALIRARSVLLTCLDDGPEDLKKPERRSVIERRIREITEVLERAKLTCSHE